MLSLFLSFSCPSCVYVCKLPQQPEDELQAIFPEDLGPELGLDDEDSHGFIPSGVLLPLDLLSDNES